MLAVQEPVPGFLGVDAGVPLGGERASGHPAGRPGLLLPQERGAPLSWWQGCSRAPARGLSVLVVGMHPLTNMSSAIAHRLRSPSG